MNSLQRMSAAIAGRPFDAYPVVNPYPFFSMMPHWPELLGLTWLHVAYGSDAQRLTCHRALHEQLGLDAIHVHGGACDQDTCYAIRVVDDAIPVLIDLATGDEMRCEELPRDNPITQRKYRCVADVRAAPAPPTADDILAGGSMAFVRKIVAELGREVFLFSSINGAFSAAFRALTFEGVYEAVLDEPSMVHALAERATAFNIAHIQAAGRVGLHAVRVNEYPCGAELLSDEHFRRFVLPYLKQTIDAIHDAGMVAIQEYLGWVEPRLEHLAGLELDCLQTESSLKGYRNDIGTMRRGLGEGVCLFSNSPILQVIEQGSEDDWRADAARQVAGIGREQRFAICAGSPTTWNTGPKRLKRYGEVMREALAQWSPPRGA